MSVQTSYRARVIAILITVVGSSLVWRPGSSPGQAGSSADRRVQGSLAARTRAFLEAIATDGPALVPEFFPSEGEFTYVRTLHQHDGENQGVWRFPAAEKLRAIQEGPLWTSFEIQFEGQPIGLFAHQVEVRGLGWHRVYGTRFVPPGAGPSSAIFVEWRREGENWVVSRFGDEGFLEGPLPSWCCRRAQ